MLDSRSKKWHNISFDIKHTGGAVLLPWFLSKQWFATPSRHAIAVLSKYSAFSFDGFTKDGTVSFCTPGACSWFPLSSTEQWRNLSNTKNMPWILFDWYAKQGKLLILIKALTRDTLLRKHHSGWRGCKMFSEFCQQDFETRLYVETLWITTPIKSKQVFEVMAAHNRLKNFCGGQKAQGMALRDWISLPCHLIVTSLKRFRSHENHDEP